jgi:hypothetical protein
VADLLVQDAVVKVSGRISAKDRNGRPSDEIKLLADEVVPITPDDVANYKSTGKTVSATKSNRQPAAKAKTARPSSVATASATSEKIVMQIKPVAEVQKRQMFVHIKNPDDHNTLQMLKRYCSEHPGPGDVILVLGDGDSKRAMKMPFRVDASSDVVPKLTALVGDDCVILK